MVAPLVGQKAAPLEKSSVVPKAEPWADLKAAMTVASLAVSSAVMWVVPWAVSSVDEWVVPSADWTADLLVEMTALT
jgi:hypothetical protein